VFFPRRDQEDKGTTWKERKVGFIAGCCFSSYLTFDCFVNDALLSMMMILQGRETPRVLSFHSCCLSLSLNVLSDVLLVREREGPAPESMGVQSVQQE
jgi:uncharacterized protein YcsI (UPF0317 family)